MSYYTIDKSGEFSDVEVFYVTASEFICSEEDSWMHERMSDDYSCDADSLAGYYYWYCMPDCLPDSDPSGPYSNEGDALAAARESAGYCPHGVADDGEDICEECPAPELWVVRTKWSDGPGWYLTRIEGTARYFSPDASKALTWSTRSIPLNTYDGSIEGVYKLTDSEARRWGR